MNELLVALQALEDVVVRLDEPMANHTPYRVGGSAGIYATVHTHRALLETLRLARKHTVTWRINWPFQDVVVREGGVTGLVIRPSGEFEQVRMELDRLWIGAAAPWGAARRRLEERGLGEMAGWSGVPGALIEDAEHRRVLKHVLVAVKYAKGGKIVTDDLRANAKVPEITNPAVLVALAVGTVRPAAAPPRPGVLFKDPAHAPSGRVLEKSGVLGTRLRAWRLSADEPGSLVHLGGGNSDDFGMLIKAIQVQVEKERGVKLEPRIPIIGDRPRRRRQR